MSDALSVEEILNEAREEETRYEWLRAADYYQEALNVVADSDFLRKGEICESMAHAVYKATFQADDSNEFRERMAQAIVRYEEARRIYAESNEVRKAPRIPRCEAMIAFAEYWVVTGPSEKKKLLEKTWSLATEAIDAFEDLAEYGEHGRIFNELSRSVSIWEHFERDSQVRDKTVERAAEYGERIIKSLLTSGDTQQLARAYMNTAIFLDDIMNPDERETWGCAQKIDDYRSRAHQLSETDASLEFISAPGIMWQSEAGEDSTIEYLTKALELAQKTRDNFLIGGALDMLAIHTHEKIFVSYDSETKVELAGKALHYAEEARKHFWSIAYSSAGQLLYWADAPHAEYYCDLSRFEMDLSKKSLLLGKAFEAMNVELKMAADSGYPRILLGSNIKLGRILRELAKIEANRDFKKKFLEEAYSHVAEAVRMTEKLLPFSFQDMGEHLGFLASIKSLLVDLASDPETKKSILQEAIIDKEKSLNLIFKNMQIYGLSVAGYAWLGSRQYEYGQLLSRFHALVGDRQYLRKAIEAFEKAAESYQKPEILSRVGECHWKVAAAYDVLEENEKAAKNFELAHADYEQAAVKIPQLKDFYLEHASYMQAWSEIEKARHYHARSEYDFAESSFMKASELHKSSKKWDYLAPNYAAWAKMARAEELSRKDVAEEALRAFQQAGHLFREAKHSVETRITRIEDQEEKKMLRNLIGACDVRREYCEARVAFEQARVFGKMGDHSQSARKYEEAVETLEKIIQRVESEQDRRELQFIISLSRAWENMARAEAESAPALYLEASRFFEEAKGASLTERAKLLSLGYSRFCRALEASARFYDTRDPSLHSLAKQNLESSMDYYVRADFKKAAEYAKATGLLLDTYLYMSKASEESEPEKKAKLYIMIEKVLQASAGFYIKSDNPAKSEQVQRLLENVKEQRELALSLNEVLHAPLMGSTAAFPSATPTYEAAIGLERLEHADVQENVVASRRNLHVGETLDVEIELVNAGKATASLDKIEEAIPEGFEILNRPQAYRVEGYDINMKGRRLDPLKTEEVKLSLKPKFKGSFTLGPRVLYLDEEGNAKSSQPQPVTIKVEELGIKGWIRGNR
jgi:exonuclease VII small subunit